MRCNEDGRGPAVRGAKRSPGVSTEHGHGCSRCCLARRQVSRQALSADGDRCTEQAGFPARVTCPELPTRPDACLAEQPGQALHAVEGVEVVHVLVQPVHPILVLQAGRDNALDNVCLPGPQTSPAVQQVCVHGKQVPGVRGESGSVGMGGSPGPVTLP